MNQEENTTFIGFGNMGSAIVKAIDKDKCFKQINVIEPDEIKKISYKNSKINFESKISENLSNSKYVWLCIKPQLFKKISLDLKPLLLKDQVLVSIMAGITKKQIIKELLKDDIVLNSSTTSLDKPPNEPGKEKSVEAPGDEVNRNFL